MKAQRIAYLKVGEKDSIKRLWVQGKYLKKYGFEKGTEITVSHVDFSKGRLVVRTCEKGEKTVSGRRRGGSVSPIICICSDLITRCFGLYQRVRAVVRKGQIVFHTASF